MATLQLLGPIGLRDDGGRELNQLLGQPKRFALLAYLAGNAPRRFHRRDHLLALFWPESTADHARHALRQALYELRNYLGEDVIVSRGTDEIALNETTVTCDVAMFQSAVTEDDNERAIDLYRGDFLEGFFVSGAPELEHWIDNRRAEIRGQAVEVSLRLASEREMQGDITGAVTVAQHAVVMAPTDEVGVRRLLSLLDKQGNSGEAFRVYSRLVRELGEQFEAQPSPETTALVKRLREATEGSQPATVAGSASSSKSDIRATETVLRPEPRTPTFSRGGIVAVVVLAALSSIILLAQAFPNRPIEPAGPIEPRWIIVAEFEGSADSTIRGAARDLVIAALDQSPAVRTLPPSSIRRGLRIAGKPDTARLTEELALELAVRGQIPAVFAGQVNKVGSTYALSFRAVAADSGAAIITAGSIAQTEDEIIPRVNEAAIEIVKGVQDDPNVLGPLRPPHELMTASMRALQAYREGRFADAVAIDSTFSQAWARMAVRLLNNDRLDSAKVVIAKALSHPERLPAYDRFRSEAFIKFAEHDYRGAYELFQDAWEVAGSGSRGATNVAVILSYMNQYERAVEAMRASSSAPFGRGPNTITNELYYMLASGMLDDASPLLEELAEVAPAASIRRWEMAVHILRGRWSQAESIAAQLTSDPTTPLAERLDAVTVEASTLAVRGEVQAATAHLVRGRQQTAEVGGLINAVSGGERNGVDGFQQRLNLLRQFGVASRDELLPDTTTMHGLFEASLDAALAGDSDRARGYLRAYRSHVDHIVAPLASAPDVVDAVLAASSAEWDSVITTLTPMEAWTWPHRLRYGPALGGLVLTLLAQAHEAAGQLDSAVRYYEKLTSPVEFIRRNDPFASGLVHPFARQRLVVLHARMGRTKDAARHWKIFAETFTSPDTGLVYLLDEAREALATSSAR